MTSIPEAQGGSLQDKTTPKAQGHEADNLSADIVRPLLDPDDPHLCKYCGFAEWRHKQDRPYTCNKFEEAS